MGEAMKSMFHGMSEGIILMDTRSKSALLTNRVFDNQIEPFTGEISVGDGLGKGEKLSLQELLECPSTSDRILHFEGTNKKYTLKCTDSIWQSKQATAFMFVDSTIVAEMEETRA